MPGGTMPNGAGTTSCIGTQYLQVFVLPSIGWHITTGANSRALRPEAKVILTERPEEQWWESFCNTIKLGMDAQIRRSVHLSRITHQE